jgi:hypothetical protein
VPVGVKPSEDGVKQRDALNDEARFRDLDPVTNVVWVLDEEEDARAKDFLRRGGKDEGHGEQSRAGTRETGSKTRAQDEDCRHSISSCVGAK